MRQLVAVLLGAYYLYILEVSIILTELYIPYDLNLFDIWF